MSRLRLDEGGVLIGLVLDELRDIGVQNVKIGCIDGASFFYCGPILPKRTTKKADVNLKRAYREKMQRLRADFVTTINCFPSFSAFIRSQGVRLYNPQLDMSPEQYLEYCINKGCFELLEKRRAAFIEAKQKYDQFIQIGLRNCVECYSSIHDDNCWICLVEGDDRGWWWDMEEASRGVMREEDDDE